MTDSTSYPSGRPEAGDSKPALKLSVKAWLVIYGMGAWWFCIVAAMIYVGVGLSRLEHEVSTLKTTIEVKGPFQKLP